MRFYEESACIFQMVKETVETAFFNQLISFLTCEALFKSFLVLAQIKLTPVNHKSRK
jgi:hypothetical protein